MVVGLADDMVSSLVEKSGVWTAIKKKWDQRRCYRPWQCDAQRYIAC